MNKLIACCALTVFLMGCNSTPKTVTASSATNQAPAKAVTASTAASKETESNQTVCKMQKVLGSNMKKKVCTTKARIAENEADTKRAVNDMSMGRTEPLLGQ